MIVTPAERIEILSKYGTVDVMYNTTDGSYIARFIGAHNFNKFGWSYNSKDNAISGLYDAVQAAFLFSCVGPGMDLDFDYES